MPSRPVPHFILEAHEVHVGDQHDVDWTLSSDWVEECRLREERNEMIRAQLARGKTVAFRQSGWSLFPRVHSNDLCSYQPVQFEHQIDTGDVVFCTVQPRGHYYAHLIKEKEWDYTRRGWKYCISNLAGRVNGHCFIEHVYGKLFQVLH